MRTWSLIRRENDVWRLETARGTYFLKAYTKDWYGDDMAATQGCVTHEAAAYRVLQTNGLGGPGLVWQAKVDGRPVLLLSRLPGRPLTDLLTPDKHSRVLFEVGRYMAAMHAIPYLHPGYLMSVNGPQTPPDPLAWGHPIWTLAHARAAAEVRLQRESSRLPARLLEGIATLFEEADQHLAPTFLTPHFAHGDCHAHQFFLQEDEHGWQITGVLDMEVASAGATDADLAKLAIELRSVPGLNRWWEPLFDGYGREPELEVLRFWMLLEGQEGNAAHGKVDWPRLAESLVTAQNWAALLQAD